MNSSIKYHLYEYFTEHSCLFKNSGISFLEKQGDVLLHILFFWDIYLECKHGEIINKIKKMRKNISVDLQVSLDIVYNHFITQQLRKLCSCKGDDVKGYFADADVFETVQRSYPCVSNHQSDKLYLISKYITKIFVDALKLEYQILCYNKKLSV
jgi:hypothetical protein